MHKRINKHVHTGSWEGEGGIVSEDAAWDWPSQQRRGCVLHPEPCVLNPVPATQELEVPGAQHKSEAETPNQQGVLGQLT